MAHGQNEEFEARRDMWQNVDCPNAPETVSNIWGQEKPNNSAT